MAVKISLEKLLETGAHFGHQARRWNPKMSSYLYGVQEGIYVFDLTKTKDALEAALSFLLGAKKDGKVILFLGTKKQARDKTKEVAQAVGSPFVYERWLGGTFTNFGQIKKSLNKLSDMKAKMASGEYNKFTKKERLLLEREIDRLERFFGGLSGMETPPDVLFVVDTHKEVSAVKEAKKVGVTVVGITDSNADPRLVDYPIPMNDDAAKAVEYVLDLVKETLLVKSDKKQVTRKNEKE